MRLSLMSHGMKTVIGWKFPEVERRGPGSQRGRLAQTGTPEGGDCEAPEAPVAVE